MGGVVSPGFAATSVSIIMSVLAGLFGVWVGLRSRPGGVGHRGLAVSLLFGMAVLLIVLIGIAAALFATLGVPYLALLKDALLLTAAFAVLGALFGLVRIVVRGVP
jgi:hypothetical protein